VGNMASTFDFGNDLPCKYDKEKSNNGKKNKYNRQAEEEKVEGGKVLGFSLNSRRHNQLWEKEKEDCPRKHDA